VQPPLACSRWSPRPSTANGRRHDDRLLEPDVVVADRPSLASRSGRPHGWAAGSLTHNDRSLGLATPTSTMSKLECRTFLRLQACAPNSARHAGDERKPCFAHSNRSSKSGSADDAVHRPAWEESRRHQACRPNVPISVDPGRSPHLLRLTGSGTDSCIVTNTSPSIPTTSVTPRLTSLVPLPDCCQVDDKSKADAICSRIARSG